MDYVLNLMNPADSWRRIMPTKNAVEATREVVRRSKVYPLIAANLEKGGNGIGEEGTAEDLPWRSRLPMMRQWQRRWQKRAVEARAVGANWSFAPIIDIDSNFRNPITNTRTFGSDPERVARMGLSL